MDNAAMAKVLDEHRSVFESFKKENDLRLVEIKALGEAKAQTEEKVDKLNKQLDDFAKVLAKFNRPDFALVGPDGKTPLSEKAQARKTVFDKFLRQGKDVLTPDERKVMLVSDDTGGGFLTIPELVLEIDKNIVEVSPMRQHARVRTTNNRSINAPTRTGTPKSEFVGEGKAPAKSQSAYGLDIIHTHIHAATVEVSQEDLEDSGFDLEGEIAMDVGEQFAFGEGEAFVIGDGVNKPQGFTTDTGVARTETAGSLVVASDDIIDLHFAVKSFYWPRASFFLHRTYIGVVRKLKDDDKQYLWQPGLNGATQSTLMGRPVVEMPDMVDTSVPAVDQVVIAFGEMMRGYWIIDRRQMAVVRDEFTRAKEGIITFIFRKRVGGQVRRREALQFLDLKA